ncbi:hypothetical protein EVAR_89931_1 [Eumeta japonica]|uniref:Uncharacterized protein n=1 Tax=Eumeta variegata TaxID=151549 RepID=A0A4C1XPC6_EUMVA|nr:hypothetical protein EVAR_89931_1 [Eumeta japonica]
MILGWRNGKEMRGHDARARARGITQRVRKEQRYKNNQRRDSMSSSPLAPTQFPENNRHGPNIIDIALVKGVALRLGGIETLQHLNSNHRPVLLKLGPLTDDRPNPRKTIIN